MSNLMSNLMSNFQKFAKDLQINSQNKASIIKLLIARFHDIFNTSFKKYMLFNSILIVSLFFITSCSKETYNEVDQYETNFDKELVKEEIKQNLAVIADPSFGGREAGSKGYDLASEYVAKKYAEMGLMKFDDDYYQKFDLVSSKISSAEMSIYNKGEVLKDMAFKDDFVAMTNYNEENVNIKSELVFAGYGISSSFHDYDDYENLNVEDKIVVVFTGGPKGWSIAESAYLSHSRTKIATAIEKGAKGVIFLYAKPRMEQYPYDSVKRYTNYPSINWIDAERKRFSDFGNGLINTAIVNPEHNHLFFANVKDQYETIQSLADESQKLPIFDLNLSMSFSVKSENEFIPTQNIVGMIEGRDELLKDEYVVLTAHLDAIGTRERKNEETGETEEYIIEGAMDNGMGVSMMLSVANAIKDNPLKRSVIIVALAAEEKGLRGSDYFVNNPIVPMSNIVANINLDMPLILYEFSDIIAFGAEHSSLYKNLEKVAGEMKINITPDPVPELAIFTRSDHFNFVKKGVPSLFLFSGFEGEGRNVFDEFMSTFYHRDGDNLDLPINYDEAAKFAKMKYLLTVDVGEAEGIPVWNEDSFFSTMRK